MNKQELNAPLCLTCPDERHVVPVSHKCHSPYTKVKFQEQKVSVSVCVTDNRSSKHRTPGGRELCMCLCGSSSKTTPCRLLGGQAQQIEEASVISEHTRTKPSELYYKDGATKSVTVNNEINSVHWSSCSFIHYPTCNCSSTTDLMDNDSFNEQSFFYIFICFLYPTRLYSTEGHSVCYPLQLPVSRKFSHLIGMLYFVRRIYLNRGHFIID